MNNSRNNNLAKKIKILTAGKNVTWEIKRNKIYLCFKIIIENIMSDYVIVAAFNYRKCIHTAGPSAYIIEFECEENNLEFTIINARDVCEKITEEAKNISQCEDGLDMKELVQLKNL